MDALYQRYLLNPNIQTDTRKIKEGDGFFALKGPSFNGNDFAIEALNKGAAYAVIDQPIQSLAQAPPSHFLDRLMVVEDGLTALQNLAKYHRQQFQIPFLAITGSNGKTTSKELIAATLSTHLKTYTTQGNLNNHIGIPLTILQVRPDAEIAVIEMGANHQKEIESYCEYTQPNYGLITNCGKAHLAGFGGEEGVKKGKGELFTYLKNHQGKAFLFDDYPYLHSLAEGIETQILYGTKRGNVQGICLASDPFLQVQITAGWDSPFLIKTQLVGDYNLPNVLAAVCVGKHFGVPQEKIIAAIENYTPSNSRSQLMVQDSNQIILDAYNANPSSMKLAIENFANSKAKKKLLLLGAMMELGDASLREHQAIIDLIEKYSWDEVLLVGGDFAHLPHSFSFCPNALAAKTWFENKAPQDSHILIKGSRSMEMEKILGK